MLCQRPVDKADRPQKTTYCFTVTERSELGVNPSKIKPRRERKRVIKALTDHKKWLESLKSEVHYRKERTMKEMLEEEIKRTKIKEKSQKARELIKEGHSDQISQVYPYFDPVQVTDGAQHQPSKTYPQPNQQTRQDIQPATINEGTQTTPAPRRQYHQPTQPAINQSNDADKPTFKKKAKPAWAMTAAEHDAVEDKEVDDLLDFIDQFDAQKYAQDVEVREMMANLKDRVGELKKEDNWKENWEKRLKDRRKKREEEYIKEKESKMPDDDMIAMIGDANGSQIGVMGGSLGSRGEARTVMSERTQESINSIKEKLELQSQGKGDWNKSVSDKSAGGKFEERLAKHIADEMLRTNPALARIHSNHSVRRIIEQELQKQINETENSMK